MAEITTADIIEESKKIHPDIAASTSEKIFNFLISDLNKEALSAAEVKKISEELLTEDPKK